MKSIKKLDKNYWKLKFKSWTWFQGSSLKSNPICKNIYIYIYNYLYMSPFVQTIINYPIYTLRYNNKFNRVYNKVYRFLTRYKMKKKVWPFVFALFFLIGLHYFYLSFVKFIILFVSFWIFFYSNFNFPLFSKISEFGNNRLHFFTSRRKRRTQEFILNTFLRRKKFILWKLKGHLHRIELPLNYKRHNLFLRKADFREFTFNPFDCKKFGHPYQHLSYYYFVHPLFDHADSLIEQKLLKNYLLSHKHHMQNIKSKFISKNYILASTHDPKAKLVIKQVYATYYVYDYKSNLVILLSCFAICWEDSNQCFPILPLGPWCPYKVWKKAFFEYIPWKMFQEAWSAVRLKRHYFPVLPFFIRFRNTFKPLIKYAFYTDCIAVYHFWTSYFLNLIKWIYKTFKDTCYVAILVLNYYRRRFEFLYYIYTPVRYLYKSKYRKYLKYRLIPWFRPHPFSWAKYREGPIHEFKMFCKTIFYGLKYIVDEGIIYTYLLFYDLLIYFTFLAWMSKRQLLYHTVLWVLNLVPPFTYEDFLKADKKYWDLKGLEKLQKMYLKPFYDYKMEFLGSNWDRFLIRCIRTGKKKRIIKRLSSWRNLLKYRVKTSYWYSYKILYHCYLLLKTLVSNIPNIIFHLFDYFKTIYYQIRTLNTKKPSGHSEKQKQKNPNLSSAIYWKYYIVELHLKILNLFYKLYGKGHIPTYSIVYHNILYRRIVNPTIKFFPYENFNESFQDDLLRLLRIDLRTIYYKKFWLNEQFTKNNYFALLSRTYKFSIYSLDKSLVIVNDPVNNDYIQFLLALSDQLNLLTHNNSLAEFSQAFHKSIVLYHAITKKKLLCSFKVYIPLLQFSNIYFTFENFHNSPLISQNQIDFSINLPYSTGAKTMLYKHNTNTSFIELICNDLHTNELIWKNIVSNRISDELTIMINLLKLNIKDSCQNIYNIYRRKANRNKMIVRAKIKSNNKLFSFKLKSKFFYLINKSCDNLLISPFQNFV